MTTKRIGLDVVLSIVVFGGILCFIASGRNAVAPFGMVTQGDYRC